MIKSLTPRTIPAPFARYAHGVTVHGADSLVFTSGQLALDLDGNTPEGSKAQALLCFKNIDAILQEAGTDFRRVVRVNAFVSAREHMAGYMEARDLWLADSPHLPASTLMIVTGFTRPEFLVEIEVIAMLAQSKP